jgi:type III secretion system low calcium response chaperone LcrH/SycD
MNQLDKIIEDTMKTMDSKLSQEDKLKYRKIFKQILKNGKKPSEVLGFSPEMIEHMYAYGYRLFNLGNYKKALHVFIGLSLLDRTDPRFNMALGAAYHKLKKYVKAVNFYYKCSQQELDNPMPHFYMYDCFLQGELIGDAAFCLKEVIRRSGNLTECAELKVRCRLLLEPLQVQIAEFEAKLKEKNKKDSRVPQATIKKPATTQKVA